jgi:arabinofuranosyltransferase
VVLAFADVTVIDHPTVLTAPEETAPAAAPDRRREGLRSIDGRRVVALAVLLAPVAFVAMRGWSHRWMADDGFINLRLVQETLAGRPFQFNPGERVEAGTSPLWVVILLGLQVLLGWAIQIEWLAVLAGLALTTGGLAAGVLGASRLWRASGFRSMLLPAGVLVLAALPPVWDFATSGLETGLWFAWLGACLVVLARRVPEPGGSGAEARSALTPLAAPVLLGLGPLVRPDFFLFSAAFVGLHLHLSRPVRVEWARAVLWAVALPVAYQIFRMGWFASVVPSPALATEAGRSFLERGTAYVADLAGTYALAVPLAVIAIWAVAAATAAAVRGARPAVVVTVTCAGAGLVHIGYVMWVGGDFMHGRLLLPGLLMLLLPVLALPVLPSPRGTAMAATAALVVWALVCATTLRVDDRPTAFPKAITNERTFWLRQAGQPEHNVTLDDNADFYQVARAAGVRQAHDRGEDRFIGMSADLPLRSGSGVIVDAGNIGMIGLAVGPDVPVIDSLGLADPVHARFQLDDRSTAPHEKAADSEWILAKLPLSDPINVRGIDWSKVADARRALECPAVRELRAAVSNPMTPARFVQNLFLAPTLTRLRIPTDPTTAAACPY